MADLSAPSWCSHLTEDDEWPIRTALACIAADLEKVAASAEQIVGPSLAIRASAQRYREVLGRIELSDV
jgi:hypothetical protein